MGFELRLSTLPKAPQTLNPKAVKHYHGSKKNALRVSVGAEKLDRCGNGFRIMV